MSYVGNFYKEANHNYAEFFNGFNVSEEIVKMKNEINALTKQIEEKTTKYSILLNKRYNSKLTPITNQIVCRYEKRNSNNEYILFDLSNGMFIKDYDSDAILINLDTRSGFFTFVSGYCYEIGCVLTRKYKYSIHPSNTKISLSLIEENLVSLLENIVVTSKNTSESINTTSAYDNYSSPEYIRCLDRINASNFINEFYGIDKQFDFSLRDMRRRAIDNKSFEIIIRTCEDSNVMKALFDIKSEKAVPIHELIGSEKKDWEYAKELGVLYKFVLLKKDLMTDEFYKGRTNKSFPAFDKTDKEWIELIEKINHWEEDLNFYTINYRGNLLKTLVQSYMGGQYPFYYSKLSNYYTFSKYSSYVVEESINQGYTNLESFINTLTDYLRMCEELGASPTLFSSYLRQTHDIVARNHKIKLKEEQEIVFAERYENFEAYKDDDYTVIAPVNSADLQKEGDNLNHCVASYIKRVVDNECLILFLRKVKNPLESLVTLEIRKNSIVQARGLHNRGITSEERNALIKFGTKRGISVRV